MAGAEARARQSILSDTSSLTDFGMILGAMAAAAATQAVRAHGMAAGALARSPRPRRPADGLGRAHRLWLQHRRVRRRRRLRLAARLGVVRRGARRLRARHPAAAGCSACRAIEGDDAAVVYAVVLVVGLRPCSPITCRARRPAERCRPRISPAPARPAARLVRRRSAGEIIPRCPGAAPGLPPRIHRMVRSSFAAASRTLPCASPVSFSRTRSGR